MSSAVLRLVILLPIFFQDVPAYTKYFGRISPRDAEAALASPSSVVITNAEPPIEVQTTSTEAVLMLKDAKQQSHLIPVRISPTEDVLLNDPEASSEVVDVGGFYVYRRPAENDEQHSDESNQEELYDASYEEDLQSEPSIQMSSYARPLTSHIATIPSNKPNLQPGLNVRPQIDMVENRLTPVNVQTVAGNQPVARPKPVPMQLYPSTVPPIRKFTTLQPIKGYTEIEQPMGYAKQIGPVKGKYRNIVQNILIPIGDPDGVESEESTTTTTTPTARHTSTTKPSVVHVARAESFVDTSRVNERKLTHNVPPRRLNIAQSNRKGDSGTLRESDREKVASPVLKPIGSRDRVYQPSLSPQQMLHKLMNGDGPLVRNDSTVASVVVEITPSTQSAPSVREDVTEETMTSAVVYEVVNEARQSPEPTIQEPQEPESSQHYQKATSEETEPKLDLESSQQLNSSGEKQSLQDTDGDDEPSQDIQPPQQTEPSQGSESLQGEVPPQTDTRRKISLPGFTKVIDQIEDALQKKEDVILPKLSSKNAVKLFEESVMNNANFKIVNDDKKPTELNTPDSTLDPNPDKTSQMKEKSIKIMQLFKELSDEDIHILNRFLASIIQYRRSIKKRHIDDDDDTEAIEKLFYITKPKNEIVDEDKPSENSKSESVDPTMNITGFIAGKVTTQKTSTATSTTASESTTAATLIEEKTTQAEKSTVDLVDEEKHEQNPNYPEWKKPVESDFDGIFDDLEDPKEFINKPSKNTWDKPHETTFDGQFEEFDGLIEGYKSTDETSTKAILTSTPLPKPIKRQTAPKRVAKHISNIQSLHSNTPAPLIDTNLLSSLIKPEKPLPLNLNQPYNIIKKPSWMKKIEEETSEERTERVKNDLQKLIQFVSLMSHVDSYLVGRAKDAVKKFSLILDTDEELNEYHSNRKMKRHRQH